MSRVRLLVISGFSLLVVVLLGLFVFNKIRVRGAALAIETEPLASVFIDGEQVGNSPFSATLKPKEVTIKLVPQAQVPLPLYETKVRLVSGVKTVVRRVFRSTEETSYGEIISFEKIAGKEAVISIVTNPDAAQISLDGKIVGFSPHKVAQVVPGEHQISLSANGYEVRNISVKAVKGYRLILIVKLARAEEAKEEVKAKESQKKEVVIKETPTGFLRVRQEAQAEAPEVGRVKPGEKYEVLSEIEGWYKISFAEEEGWISSQYATLETPP